MSPRYIHSHLSNHQIPDLLQTIFIAELIYPSACLWLVSAWLSDIPILDNTANSFISLQPLWNRQKDSLSQILIALAEKGTTIHIATNSESHNYAFMETLKSQIAEGKIPIQLHIEKQLHAKGLLGDNFYLAGSMNFTYNGITINEEALTYETSPEIIAEQKLIF